MKSKSETSGREADALRKCAFSTSERQQKRTNNLNDTTMNQRRKMSRVQRAAQEEKQAKGVIRLIFGVLVLLAILCIAVYIINFM